MIRKIAIGAIVTGFVLLALSANNSCAQSGISGDIQRLEATLIGDSSIDSAHPLRRGAHHGILINDVFVAPVSHNEPAGPCCESYPCCEKSCGKKSCGSKKCDRACGKSCSESPAECAGCPACPASKSAGCVEGKCMAEKNRECQRCQSGSCPQSEEAKQQAAHTRDHANETARAVLEIMDALGHSVIAGTEFEPAPEAAPEELPTPLAEPTDIRAALMKYIRALETQRAAEVQEAATVNISDEAILVSDLQVSPESGVVVVVDALRDSSMVLDEAASQLESLELYERADQVRALAQELRHDARRMKTGGRVVHARRHTFPVVEPTCDEVCPGESGTEIEHRLHQLREAMRRGATE